MENKSNTDEIIIQLENTQIKRKETEMTEYFSAHSEPIVIEMSVNLNKSNVPLVLQSPLSSKDIRLKNPPFISEVSYYDSFETVSEEPENQNHLESDYAQLREYVANNEIEKIRENEGKILQKEIARRKINNNKRLQKLKSLEEKLTSEVKTMLDTSANVTNKNIKMVHPYLPVKQTPNDHKVNLVLVNKNKGEGFSVVTQEEFEMNFDEHKFCDYVFYTKK